VTDLRFYENWEWDPSFGEHAELGPSASSIWLACVGAPQAQKGRPDDAGFEAAEGTVFHEWAEICLKFDLEPHHIVIGTETTVEAGGKSYTIAYDEKMRDSMYEGLAFIREAMKLDPDAILYVEKKVNLEPWCGPKQFGTTDVCIVCPNLKLIIVFDWKYGGIPVYPEGNSQAGLYTLGSWVSYAGKHFDFDPHGVKVHIHIEQPRAPGGGGDWHTTMSDLLAWGEDVRIKADLTRQPNAPRTAGEKQCRYCKARKPSAGKPACATYLAHKLDLFGMKFEDLDTGFENGTPPVLPEIDELTPERLSYIYLNRASLMKFLEELHEIILDNHDRGRPTPLLKVVSGRGGARKPKASAAKAFEYTAKAWLGDAAYTKPTLLSAPKIEELVGKKAFKESFAKFVTAEPPGRSLVVIQDARDAHVPVADKLTDEDLN
jgi:hypothetical protein